MSELLDLGGHGLGRRYDALNAGWRGAMLRALDLPGADVQWVPGLPDARATATAAGLSALADRVPSDRAMAPAAVGGALMPRWSDAYRRLLGALLPETGVGLRGCLGAEYASWVRFRNAADADLTQKALFRRWSNAALPAHRRRAARRVFEAAARDPVSRARDAMGALRFHDADIAARGRLGHVPGYGIIPGAAAEALFPVRGGGRVIFDSDRLVAAETGRLRHGGVRRPALIPGLCGDAFDPLERRLATARITVRGHVGARAVLPVTPGGWYDAEIVARACAADACPDAWDACAVSGGWPAFFGPRGAMRRQASHLVLVSDMTLCWTCAGRFDDTEQRRLLAALGLHAGRWAVLRAPRDRAGGIWPFVTAPGAVTPLQARARFDGGGSLVLDLTLAPGRLAFWGVRVGGPDLPV